MQITKKLIPESKYKLKCPYQMKPTHITIHNTYNNASALNDVNYVKSNQQATSCHIFVDENEAIQCLPLDRNGWHAGDGAEGTGNRKSIGIEICRSTDYTSERHSKAYMNAVQVVQQLMKEYSIPFENVVQHSYWTGKNCPHRIREEGTWNKFLSLCKEKQTEGGSEEMIYINGNPVYLMMEDDNSLLTAIENEGNPTPKTVGSVKSLFEKKYGKIKMITAGPYFINKPSQSNYGDICGRLQGENMDRTPDQKEWLDVSIGKDNVAHVGDFASWDWTKEYARFGFSPVMMLISGCDMKSPDLTVWHNDQTNFSVS